MKQGGKYSASGYYMVFFDIFRLLGSDKQDISSTCSILSLAKFGC